MLSLKGLQIRAALMASIRCYFAENGFLEVDTPILQPVLIPEAYISPIDSQGGYLQTSPEICMKRVLALGAEKIFQICPCFRKEERGSKHLEEFTMLEWYCNNSDYRVLMEDCQKLLYYVTCEMKKIFPADIHYIPPESLEMVSVEEAFSRYSPVSLEDAIEADDFDRVLVEYIEPLLGFERPSVLYDYPLAMASLAKRSDSKPDVAERMELYINSIELANGFSELTDPVEQRQRFEQEIDIAEKLGNDSFKVPEKFLKDLGMISSAAGIALGVDRLLMILMGADSIEKVVSFSPDDL